MADKWKLTAVGGAENGMEFYPSVHESVVIGRSHKAAVRLTEPDISGHHAELFVEGDMCQVVSRTATSVTLLNGVGLVHDAPVKVKAGDTLTLGAKMRLRIDAVPAYPVELSAENNEKDDERATELSGFAPEVATRATVQDIGTRATVFESVEPMIMDSASGFLPDMQTKNPIKAKPVRRVAEQTIATSWPAEDEGETATGAGEEDGCTVAAVTQMAPQELIEEMREKLAKKSQSRKLAVMFAFLIFAATLVAVWFVSRSDKETETMSYPQDSNGRPDIVRYVLRDTDGNALVNVDFPDNPNLDKTESPDGKGVRVLSAMGRERDVPFYLVFEAHADKSELDISLMESVLRWTERKEQSGDGFVFDEHMKNDVRPEFLEDRYPLSCQTKTLYGVRFVQFEYKRTATNSEVWHGIAIYFRCGDTVYLHRREIPEQFWTRGGARLRLDPNIAVYSTFSESYWESPGKKYLDCESSIADLTQVVRSMLARERANDWRFARRVIDSVLARTWCDDVKACDIAKGYLRQYREILRVFYWQKYNAYWTAKSNRNDRRALAFRKDAEMVFDNPSERYYHLIGNMEVW